MRLTADLSRLPAAPGFRFVRRIGKGGMGEVYQAERIGPGGFRKPVALKQLALDHAIDGKAVQRFFQEARISAQLHHANIVQIHDLFVDGQLHFIVMELLSGWNLFEAGRALGEPMPWWLALAVADQALAGLGYAHALPGGLIHRDLTPRNLFLCSDGKVKILDFGIAKLRHVVSAGLTQEGHLPGTLEFLAPEQARGEELDTRTDLYLLGGSIYHALTGVCPHGSGAPAEIITRALNQPPRPIADLRPDVPAAARAVVERALARDPADRFPDAASMQAAVRAALAGAPAHDEAAIARLLARLPRPAVEPPAHQTEEIMAPVTSGAAEDTGAASTVVAPVRAVPRRIWIGVAAAAAALAGALALGRLTAGRAPAVVPHWERITFNRGVAYGARFHAGGERVVYSAAWNGDHSLTYDGVPGQPDHRALDLPDTLLAAVAPSGDLLLIVDPETLAGVQRGVLAQAPLDGGAPRELAEGVVCADVGPAGLALVRWDGGQATLEYPSGTVLLRMSPGWIDDLRVSADGSRLAYIEHPRVFDDEGVVAVVDRAGGKARRLSRTYMSAAGLAWSPGGDEIWFTAAREGVSRQLRAVNLDGDERLIADVPANLRLEDIAPDGRVLLVRASSELKVNVGGENVRGEDLSERDLSVFDATYAVGFPEDGTTVLLGEGGGDALGGYAVYLRGALGSPPKKLAEGHAVALSDDGRQAIVFSPGVDRMMLVPVYAGKARDLTVPGAVAYHWASFFPNGKRLLVNSSDAAGQRHVSVLDLESGATVAVGRPGMRLTHGGPVSHDGTQAAVLDPETDLLQIVPTAGGGDPVPLPGAKPGESALRWSPGGGVYVARLAQVPLVVYKVNSKDGGRFEWRRFLPEDPAGVRAITQLVMTEDGDNYAYSYVRDLGALYVLTGVR